MMPFRNEPYTDFSSPAIRPSMEQARDRVRRQFGQEYDLLIAGARIRTEEKLRSVNPSNPQEIVGVHQKATPAMAATAVESAHAYFAEWSRTAAPRIACGCCCGSRIFCASASWSSTRGWSMRPGRSWPEAEADVVGSHRLLRILRSRDACASAGPQPVVQLPGEKDEMRYIPLGVGVVIPPWNFPLAILAGMTVGRAGDRQHGGDQAVERNPTIAAKFAEVLLEAGFPEPVVLRC